MKTFAAIVIAADLGCLTGAYAADCTDEKMPKLGMTLEQVLSSCWDAPGKMQRTTTASRVEVRLSYQSGKINGELLLVDGRVTEIKEIRDLTPDPMSDTILRRKK